MASSIPTVQWAQRKDKLFLTIDVQDVKDEKVGLNNVDGHGVLTFSGTAGGAADAHSYALELKLLKDIDLEKSKVSVSPRNIFLVLIKTEEGHWPRLTEAPARQQTHVKVDWNKWVDEDEEDEKPEMDMSGFNFSDFGGGGMGGMGGGMGGMMGGMGGMGGMPGMEGMDFSALAGMGGDDMGEGEDSDNEEPAANEGLPELVK